MLDALTCTHAMHVLPTQNEIEHLKAQVKTKDAELWTERNEKAQLQRRKNEGDAAVASQKVSCECEFLWSFSW